MQRIIAPALSEVRRHVDGHTPLPFSEGLGEGPRFATFLALATRARHGPRSHLRPCAARNVLMTTGATPDGPVVRAGQQRVQVHQVRELVVRLLGSDIVYAVGAIDPPTAQARPAGPTHVAVQ